MTGGAKGIGAAIARRLDAEGMAVAILDLDLAAAEETASSVSSASAHAVDVASYDSVTHAVADAMSAWGRLDVIVNNAGWDRVEAFLENDPSLWDRLIGINLRGPINVCHVALPSLIGGGGGRIVNVPSDAGRVGSTGETVYAACKGGVIALTKSLAREMARHGITVNCVCPGPADTPLMKELRSTELGEKIMDAVTKATRCGGWRARRRSRTRWGSSPRPRRRSSRARSSRCPAA